ncbi:MAG: hypothetical protein FWH10_06975, partial [Oscillospiraceae bacterium]|nr:hypothetical protein [Oscillospiraceae bacterium]
MTERGNSNGGVNGSHVYRWSMADEENLRKNRRNKYAVKTKKSAGLRIFAVIMSVMFLFTAAASVYFLGDYITGGRFSSGGNDDSAGNPGFVISNKDALEETKNDSSPETANDGDIIKDTSAVAPLDNSAAGPGTLTGEEARIR